MTGERADVDAVVVDFTGVLTTSPGAGMMERAQRYGIDVGTFLPVLLGPLEVDGDHPYHELERGRITMDEFDVAVEALWRAAGLTEFPAFPRGEEFLTMVQPVEEMIEAVRAVRRTGVGTAILTNNIREWGGWRAAWNADELVDVVVDSCQVGLRKPDPAIFELTLERLGGPSPERTLYLDDFPWNIAAADRLGFQTMHVTDPVGAAAELRRRLDC